MPLGKPDVPLEIYTTILVVLPILAAAALVLFSSLLKRLRMLPEHEYVQLLRAPAWVTVVAGVCIAVLSMALLAKMSPSGAQVFIGWSRNHSSLMIDAYSLWASAIIGGVLAVASWVPAARRSLIPKVFPHFALTLALTWFALLALFAQHINVILFGWLMVLCGVIVLWALLFRPTFRWEQMELLVVLGLAALLGTTGLLWLSTLVQQNDIVSMWSVLLSSPPRGINGAMMLIALGWLGPAIYLPWWLWSHNEEETMVWMPSALLLATAGVATLVRLVFFIFPAGGGDFSQLPGVEHLFLIKRILGWLLSWGMLSLMAGTLWLAYFTVRRRVSHNTLRPVILVTSGLLLLGLAGGVLGLSGEPDSLRNSSIAGLLWTLLTWAGSTTVWITSGKLLRALPDARDERRILSLSLWGVFAAMVAIPPFSGFRAIADCWRTWQQFGAPPLLIILLLVFAAGSVGIQLPRWAALQRESTTYPGAGWGILGPFVFTVTLILLGVLAGPFSPVLRLIRLSLLQAY